VKSFIPFLLVFCACSQKPIGAASGKNVFADSPAGIPYAAPLPFYPHREIDTFLLGDLNSDNAADTAIVFSPVFSMWHPEYGTDDWCKDDSCVTQACFSFDTAVLTHTAALGFYSFFACEDLDDDGVREVVLVPNWFQSCWQGLFVYSLQNGEWIQLGSGSVYACHEEHFDHRVRKIDSHTFEIISQGCDEDCGNNTADIPKRIKIN
jgi:hypothetical protein